MELDDVKPETPKDMYVENENKEVPHYLYKGFGFFFPTQRS